MHVTLPKETRICVQGRDLEWLHRHSRPLLEQLAGYLRHCKPADPAR
jgi:hypothetical protein